MTQESNINEIVKVVFIEIDENFIKASLLDGSEIVLHRNLYDITKIYQYFSDNRNKVNNEYFVINFNNYLILQEKEKNSFFNNIIKKSFYKLRSIFNNKIHEETFSKDSYVGIIGNCEIPNVNKLNAQINHAKKIGNTKGMEIFINKLTKIIDKRGHSVDDLLTFIENADLPITTDGYVLAYKAVRKTSENKVYVDCHSRRIKQKLGDFIYMDENSVDNDRRVSCSHGLHIATRHYIGRYSLGNTVLVVKVAPENFIAVPIGEPTKVRVSGYHIVGILSDKASEILLNSQDTPFPEKDLNLIKDIINCKHVPILQKVFIENEFNKSTKIEKTKIVSKKTNKNIKTNNVLVENSSPEENLKKEFKETKSKIINNIKHEKNIINDRKNGMSIKALAKKYKHSDRTIKKILSKHS